MVIWPGVPALLSIKHFRTYDESAEGQTCLKIFFLLVGKVCTVIPSSSGLSVSGRCEDASFAAMMSLISKNFQENVREISPVVGVFQFLWGPGLVLVKRSLETRVYAFGTETDVTCKWGKCCHENTGPKPDGPYKHPRDIILPPSFNNWRR
jgi:hypothetical protein